MITSALEFLRDQLGATETFEANGREFSTRKVYQIPDKFAESTPDVLTVNTLTGLRDYVKDVFEDDRSAGNIAFIHVISPNEVAVVSTLFGDLLQRKNWLTATTRQGLSQNFSFNTFMDIPNFIIGLQAYFAETPDVKRVLDRVSNIKAVQGQEYADNGVSQKVTASKSVGSSLVELQDVPNPVTLKPYRTFLEVDQPASSFVFRLTSGGEDNPPRCGLFEASGGAWKLDAILKIKAWLEDQELGMDIIA